MGTSHIQGFPGVSRGFATHAFLAVVVVFMLLSDDFVDDVVDKYKHFY